MRIKNVLIGWAKKMRLLPVAEAEKKLSELRLKQCVDCPLHKLSKSLKLISGGGVYVEQIYCTECKCPCEAKTLVVNESCPKNKW